MPPYPGFGFPITSIVDAVVALIRDSFLGLATGRVAPNAQALRDGITMPGIATKST